MSRLTQTLFPENTCLFSHQQFHGISYFDMDMPPPSLLSIFGLDVKMSIYKSCEKYHSHTGIQGEFLNSLKQLLCLLEGI